MANPTDGYAYNKVELGAIWSLPVELADVVNSFAKKFEFMTQCAASPTNPEREKDAYNRDLIKRALLAEVGDPEPDWSIHDTDDKHVFINGSCGCGATFPTQ